MWQRFSEQARKVIFYAQEESLRKNDDQVRAEHLLFGVFLEPSPVIAKALESFECNATTLSRQISDRIVEKQPGKTSESVLSADSKRIIDATYEVGRLQDSSTIEPKYLIVGILKLASPVACGILAEIGISHRALLTAILKEDHLNSDPPKWASQTIDATAPIAQATMWQRCSVGSRIAIFHAQKIAREKFKTQVDTEDLVLGILTDPDNGASWLLMGCNVNPESVKSALMDGQDLPSIGEETAVVLSPEVKEVLNSAYQLAVQTGGDAVRTQHLLLGVVAEKKGLGGRVLRSIGLELKLMEAHARAVQGVHLKTEDQ